MNRQQRRQQGISHCHKKIKEVAQGITRANYEDCMSSSNDVYLRWKKLHPEMNAAQLELEFVRCYWSRAIDAARATLTLLLREPLDDRYKEEIVEVLTLDATLMRGRRNPAQVQGAMEQKR